MSTVSEVKFALYCVSAAVTTHHNNNSFLPEQFSSIFLNWNKVSSPFTFVTSLINIDWLLGLVTMIVDPMK
jgi:hypothetical protein